jgi:PII-like signaling protein
MMEFIENELLRIFVGEQSKLHHRPLYEVIVDEALKQGLAGATVIKGVLSFGHHHRVHTTKILELSGNLPMVVEIVDGREKIERFLPEVERIVRESSAKVLVTREKVRRCTISGGTV